MSSSPITWPSIQTPEGQTSQIQWPTPTNEKSDMDLIMEGISKLPKSTIKLLAGPMGQGNEQPTGRKSNEGYTEGPSVQNLLKNI